jgi:hypothetical protein
MSEPIVFVANPNRQEGLITMVMPQFRGAGTEPVIECSGFVFGATVDLVRAIVLPNTDPIPERPPENSIAVMPSRVEDVQDEVVFSWRFGVEDRDEGERRDYRLPGRLGFDNRLVVYARSNGVWYRATDIDQLFIGAAAPSVFSFKVGSPLSGENVPTAGLRFNGSGFFVPVKAVWLSGPVMSSVAAIISPTRPISPPSTSNGWIINTYPGGTLSEVLYVPQGKKGQNVVWVMATAFMSNVWTPANSFGRPFNLV